MKMINNSRFFHFLSKEVKSFSNKIILPKIKKQEYARIDKLNILEYMGISSIRKTSNLLDSVYLELFEYFDSTYFKEELGSTLDDIEKFRFLLLHIAILNNKALNTDNSVNTLKHKLAIFFLRTKYYFYYNNNLLSYYANKEFNIYNDSIREIGSSFVLENKLNTFFKREIVKSTNAMNAICNLLNEDDYKKINKEKFKKLINWIYEENPKKEELSEFYNDKFILYFYAHKNYINSLSIKEVLSNKIFWGLVYTNYLT